MRHLEETDLREDGEADLSEPSTSQRTQDCSRQKLGDRFERKPPDATSQPGPTLILDLCGLQNCEEINFRWLSYQFVSFLLLDNHRKHTYTS